MVVITIRASECIMLKLSSQILILCIRLMCLLYIFMVYSHVLYIFNRKFIVVFMHIIKYIYIPIQWYSNKNRISGPILQMQLKILLKY